MSDRFKELKIRPSLTINSVWDFLNNPQNFYQTAILKKESAVVTPDGDLITWDMNKEIYTDELAKIIAKTKKGVYIGGSTIDVDEFVKAMKFMTQVAEQRHKLRLNRDHAYGELLADTAFMHYVTNDSIQHSGVLGGTGVLAGNLTGGEFEKYFGPHGNLYTIRLSLALSDHFGEGHTNVTGRKLEAKLTKLTDPEREMFPELVAAQRFAEENGLDLEDTDSELVLQYSSPTHFTENTGKRDDYEPIMTTYEMLDKFVKISHRLAQGLLTNQVLAKAEKEAVIHKHKTVIEAQKDDGLDKVLEPYK